MNNTRLTFNSSTNFSLPIGIFHILQRDAYYYNFIKNNQPKAIRLSKVYKISILEDQIKITV